MEKPKENKHLKWPKSYLAKIQEADKISAKIEKLKKELTTENDRNKIVSTHKAIIGLSTKLNILTSEIKNLTIKWGIVGICISAFTAVSLTALYYQPKINDLNETRDKLERRIQN